MRQRFVAMYGARPAAVWRNSLAVDGSCPSPDRETLENNNYIYSGYGHSKKPESGSLNRRRWISCYVVVASTSLLCYVNNLHGEFVHDDTKAISGNPDVVREGSTLASLFRNDFWGKPMSDPTSHKSYRPITVLSFRLNHMFGELNPVSYHVTNNLLHCLATLLFTHICRKVIFHGDIFTSFLAGLMFAVHPIHTEAVSGLVGRADVLSTIFFLLSFAAYSKYSRSVSYHSDDQSTASNVWLLWSVACGSLALLSKEHGVTVMALCIFNELHSAWQHWSSTTPGQHDSRSYRVRSKTVLKLLISLVFLCMYRIWMLGGSYPTFQEEDNPASFSPLRTIRMLTYVYLWAFNAWLIVCPRQLSHDWQMGSIPLVRSPLDIRNISSLIFMVLLVSLTWKAFTSNKLQRRSRISLGLMLTVLPFLLASNIFITVGFVVAERVLYMPSMGVIVLVVSGLDILRLYLPLYWRYLKPFSIIVLILFPACRTFIRNKVWQNRQSLARSGLQILPQNAKMHYNYGNILADIGDIDGAVSHYRTAIRLWPTYTSAHNNLGFYLSNKTEAMLHLNEAIRLSPCHANAYSNMANIYHNSLNKTDEAIRLLQLAEECEPSNPTPHLSLAAIYDDLGHGELARRHYGVALTLAPSRAGVHHQLGLYYESKGQYEAAISHFEKALSLNRPDSLKSLAKLYTTVGEVDKAKQCWTRALSIRRDPGTLDMAARFHFQIGQISTAISLYREAYSLDPNSTSIVLHLTQALTSDDLYPEAEKLLVNHLKQNPNDVELTLQLANVYGLNKQHNKAVYLIENFLKRRSNELSSKQLSALYHQIGNHMKDLQDFDLAVENYHKAIRLDNRNADCHHNLAVYYHKKHVFDRAQHHYESAYRLTPDDQLLQTNYNRLQQDLILQSPASQPVTSSKQIDNKKT